MTEKLSLTELQQIIKDSLYLALPDFYWVIGEISEITENYAGHCYLELVEKHPDEKNPKARIKAIIWSNRYRFLKSLFENLTGETLCEGMKILVKTKVEYHELYGLSLVISDIDPSFTIGEIALKRQLVIKRLEQDGVFSMNKEIEFPYVPQKIAIISSKNSAGYSDFMTHLNENSFGYVFYTALFESAMQGSETEQGVIAALDRIAGYPDLFDVVVIIRGGGSQSDLSWFDNYNIAYHVTQFPLPVITGIGHEKDLSVTDMVACHSLKTPTAVADFLIDRVLKAENSLNEMIAGIAENSRSIIEENLDLLESFRLNLIPVSRLLISRHKERLSGSIIELINHGKEYIIKAGLFPASQKSRLITATASYLPGKLSVVERKRIELINFTLNTLGKIRVRLSGLDNSLALLNPANVLKRGYTITSLNGIIIKSSLQVEGDDILETRFCDGRVISKVMDRKRNKGNKQI